MTDDGGGLCGFSAKETYDLALRFMHEKDGSKAVALSYADKLRLAALTKQASKGPFNPEHTPDVGFLDRVGNDRREAWRQLGDMPRDKAMTELVSLVDRLSPLFRPYLEAHRANRLEQERVRQEVISQDQKTAESEVLARQAAEYQRWLEHEASIRAALNEQTAVQFKHYAEQQYPNEPEKQAELIHQLQEQHFQQFMTHWYQQQQSIAANTTGQSQQQAVLQTDPQSQNSQEYTNGISQATQEQTLQESTNGDMPITFPAPSLVPVSGIPITGAANVQQQTIVTPADNAAASAAAANSTEEIKIPSGIEQAKQIDNFEKLGYENPIPLAPVRVWTHKNIKQFKETMKKESSDSLIRVGSGESITIRVPTNSDATSLYWEFMTDGYDIGFGVFFEWQAAEDDQVRIQVTDSEGEEDDDDDDEEEGHAKNGDVKTTANGTKDVEKGSSKKKFTGPPVDELLALVRRDSHLEVQCGSHDFAPARGVYLLRFDNSYSLWRTKVLYYRIYYAK